MVYLIKRICAQGGVNHEHCGNSRNRRKTTSIAAVLAKGMSWFSPPGETALEKN